MTLNHFMRQADTPTAVIIMQAEESLGYQQAKRALASVMADWLNAQRQPLRPGLPSGQAERRARLVCQARRSRGWSRSSPRPCASDGHGAVRVEPPDQAELERLMQLMHCRQGFRLADWRQAGALAQAMSAVPGELAKHWQSSLTRLSPGTY